MQDKTQQKVNAAFRKFEEAYRNKQAADDLLDAALLELQAAYRERAQLHDVQHEDER